MSELLRETSATVWAIERGYLTRAPSRIFTPRSHGRLRLFPTDLGRDCW